MERENIMSTGARYGATDAGPGPTEQAQAQARRSTDSRSKSDTGPVLPTVTVDSNTPNANGDSSVSRRGKVAVWLGKSVESKQCSAISVANCFLTGYTSAVAFSACYIW